MFLEMLSVWNVISQRSEFQYPLWIDVFGNLLYLICTNISRTCFSILFGSMFLEICGCKLTSRAVDEVSVSSLDRCFWKSLVRDTGCQPNLIVSVSSLDRCFWKYWLQMLFRNCGSVSVSSLDRCFWKSYIHPENLDICNFRFSILFGSMFLEISSSAPSPTSNPLFQYPLWIDVFGNL